MKINIQEVIYSLEADQIKKFDPNATEAILAIKKLAEDEFDHCKQIIAVYTSYLKNTSEEIIQNYNPVQIAEKKTESLVNEEEVAQVIRNLGVLKWFSLKPSSNFPIA